LPGDSGFFFVGLCCGGVFSSRFTSPVKRFSTSSSSDDATAFDALDSDQRGFDIADFAVAVALSLVLGHALENVIRGMRGAN
jgi:hypothetical protein